MKTVLISTMLALIVDSFVLYFIDAFHSLFPVVGSDRVKTQHENIIMKEKKKKRNFSHFSLKTGDQETWFMVLEICFFNNGIYNMIFNMFKQSKVTSVKEKGLVCPPFVINCFS